MSPKQTAPVSVGAPAGAYVRTAEATRVRTPSVAHRLAVRRTPDALLQM